MRGDAFRRARLEVEAGPAFTCALSPDAGMVAVVRPTALAVIATWSGAAIATLPGVERGQVVVQLARRDRVLARVTLDDRTP